MSLRTILDAAEKRKPLALTRNGTVNQGRSLVNILTDRSSDSIKEFCYLNIVVC